ncbi:hypothetical protein GW17_00028346 [Ensete ventricosum]|nr:hypothetical protein GW17_00028346 [Ensete ventricosum]
MGQGMSCAGSSYEHGFFSAVQDGHLETVRRAIDEDPSLLRGATIYDRLSALHIAAANGRVEVRIPCPKDLSFFRTSTPLMLATMHGKIACVQKLLEAGANVSLRFYLSLCHELIASDSSYPGSTPLHLAAHGGSLDCVRKLLAWGADRLQRDSVGRIPYAVALKRNHGACAALLNPSAAEPLVWPSPLKVISELDPDAKALLEVALTEANKEREKKILEGTKYSLSSPSHWDAAIPDDSSEVLQIPDWVHMQQCVSILVVAKTHDKDEGEKGTTSKLRRSRRSHNFSAESSSFKTSAMGSFSKMGRGSGCITDIDDMVDKP